MIEEKELLKKILPILMEYEYSTIKKVAEYVLNNDVKFKGYIRTMKSIVDNIDTSDKKQNAKSTTEIEEIINNCDRKIKLALKKIYKCILLKKVTVEDICNIIDDKLKDKTNIDTNSILRKKCLICLFSLLKNEKIEVIRELDYYINQKINNKTEENSLENWSSLIIKKDGHQTE